MVNLEHTSSDRLGRLPADVGLPAGERAPDATTEDAEGRPVRLADLWQDGPVALVFYRGGWCPYCNVQVRELVEAWPEFRERGLRPVLVSVDRVEEAARTKAEYTIPFPVLADPGLAAHRAFRVARQVGDDELAKLKSFGLDIEKASGRDHHVIAIPSVFLVDGRGVVRWAHADRDYKIRPSAAQILAAADAVDLPRP